MLAAIAFVGFLAAFAWELFAYQGQVVRWARRDLKSRADLAAANLEEPLRTQDFRKIHALGDQCHAEGVRLVISGLGGGRLYDSWRVSEEELPTFSASAPCGEYRVELGIMPSRVYAPFRQALVGFCLAGLVGMAGVLLFFFVTYRQHVRIRELKRLEAFRREFIADFSHELKTPLTGMLAAADMLTGNETLVGLIKKESTRLNALAQDVLSLARLERAENVLNRVPTDVVALAEDVVRALQPKAQMKGIALTFVAPPEAMSVPQVAVDAQLVSQALENLVENALRHSDSPTVEVSVSSDATQVRLAVLDHGIGIPSAHVARVFERFHRVDPSRAAESGGAGLGLAIVRRIARLHPGGDVVLEPVRPHGCRFVLSFAIARGGSR